MKIEFEILGSPDWTANCHCNECRRLHGGAPFVSLCGYSIDSISILDEDMFYERTVRYKSTANEESFEKSLLVCLHWAIEGGLRRTNLHETCR